MAGHLPRAPDEVLSGDIVLGFYLSVLSSPLDRGPLICFFLEFMMGLVYRDCSAFGHELDLAFASPAPTLSPF